MKALQIAVVEDLEQDRRELTTRLYDYFHSQHISYEIFAFSSGEEFVDALTDKWFDIVFMDIYLSGISGIQAAQALRAKDLDCKLIFITVSEDYMKQGFALNSAHYLIKPVTQVDFLQAMENCRIKRKCKVPFLYANSGRQSISLDTLDIMYIDIRDRVTTAHTKDGMFPVGRGFASAIAPLENDERFLLCNKGLLVNMDFIASLEGCDFVLVNGERLPIAPRRKRELALRYHSYIFGIKKE